MLCQEPWCSHPERIGRLTDWQIENLYAGPAAARSEELRKEMPGGKAPPPEVADSGLGEPGSPAHRNWHVSAFVNGPMAMTPARAAAEYERQLKAWRESQNGG